MSKVFEPTKIKQTKQTEIPQLCFARVLPPREYRKNCFIDEINVHNGE